MSNNLEVIDTTIRPMGGIAPTPDKGIVLEGTHFYTAKAVPFVDPLQPIQTNVQDLRDAVGYGLDRTGNEFWPFKEGELSCALKAIWDVWEDKPADADMHTLNGEYQAYLLALAHQIKMEVSRNSELQPGETFVRPDLLQHRMVLDHLCNLLFEQQPPGLRSPHNLSLIHI